MQIRGHRIQILRTPAEHGATARPPAAGRAQRTDSADIARLTWALMDQEYEAPAIEWLRQAVAEGSYWVPAPQISRSLIDDHLFVCV